jgi:hypothetical protein
MLKVSQTRLKPISFYFCRAKFHHMKYLFIIASVAFFACNMNDKAAGDKSKEAALKDSANYTTIQWLDSTTQNLGNAIEGQVLEITWRFKNTGNKPLIFADVHPGCGCTVADKPNEPVAPGEEGAIKAKFDTNHHTGTNDKKVFVKANNKNKNDEAGGQDVLGFHVEVAEKK